MSNTQKNASPFLLPSKSYVDILPETNFIASDLFGYPECSGLGSHDKEVLAHSLIVIVSLTSATLEVRDSSIAFSLVLLNTLSVSDTIETLFFGGVVRQCVQCHPCNLAAA